LKFEYVLKNIAKYFMVGNLRISKIH